MNRIVLRMEPAITLRVVNVSNAQSSGKSRTASKKQKKEIPWENIKRNSLKKKSSMIQEAKIGERRVFLRNGKECWDSMIPRNVSSQPRDISVVMVILIADILII